MFNNKNEVKQRMAKLAAVLLILVLILWTGAYRPACYAAKKTAKTKKTEQAAAKKTKKAAKKTKKAKKATKAKKKKANNKKNGTSGKKTAKTAQTKKKAAEKKASAGSNKPASSKTAKKKTKKNKAKNSNAGASSGTAGKTAPGGTSEKAGAGSGQKQADQTDADNAAKQAGQAGTDDGSKQDGQTDADNAAKSDGQTDTDDASQKTDANTDAADPDAKNGSDQNSVSSDEPDPDAEPVLHAKGVEVYCENTGEVVFSQNSSKKANLYNAASLMTALLAVQKLSPDKKITISKKAAEQPGGSAELQKGEVVTVEQLLYEMLLDSADDAAYSLAENYSGSVKSFVRRMNKTAKNIGCKHTHFSDPAGSSTDGNYTTASDFMMIARVALSNSVIKKIAAAEEYRVPKTNKHESRTITAVSTFTADKNYGIETEITGIEGDQCSTAAGYLENGLRLYIVLLDDANTERSDDLKAVIDYVKEHIQGKKVVSAGENVGKIRIGHGAKTKADVYTLETGYAYLPKEGSIKLLKKKIRFDNDIKAPVTRNQVVGSYQIYIGNDLVNSVPLILHEDIPEGWFPSYLGISNTASIVICAVFLALIIAGLLIASAREKARRRKRMAKARRIWQLAEQQLREEQERKERGWYF